MTLKRSKDRKVTNHVTPAGNPSIANSFGLPAGREYSCPGQTTFCQRVCYAGKLEKVYSGVKATLLHNWNLLNKATTADSYALLDAMISDFEAECERKKAEKLFRIHWDGDFFSIPYTIAWNEVIKNHPDTKFWVYTRVPFAAEYLYDSNHHNLSLYFSSDPDNLEIANSLAEQGIRIAHVDQTFAMGKAAVSKAARCPENNRSLPLISEKGSACAVCGLCINNRNNVLFSVSKR